MNALFSSLAEERYLPSPYEPEALLPRVEEEMQRVICGERPGLTDEMALRQVKSGGKRVRARLALVACAAFGVAPEDAIRWAAAVELLHNATLVHDDIQDGDEFRRGQATTWARFGVAQAINAGDYLLMLPFVALRDLEPALRGQLSSFIADYATRTVRGQVEELGLKDLGRFDMSGYLTACEGKTGALLALPVVGAAVLGGTDLHHAERLAAPFIQLGVLFQLQDDVVDLFGDKGRGSLGGDVYEGKVSALLVKLLELDPQNAPLVLAIMRKERGKTTEAEVLRVRKLYEESGSLQGVISEIVRIREQVLESTILRQEPHLFGVAQKLVQMAQRPIAHLLG